MAKTKGVRMVVWINFDVARDVDAQELAVEFPGGIVITDGSGKRIEATEITHETVESEPDDESFMDDEDSEEEADE